MLWCLFQDDHSELCWTISQNEMGDPTLGPTLKNHLHSIEIGYEYLKFIFKGK